MMSVSKWAKWRNDGINQMHGDLCPFCTHDLETEVINEQNKVFEKVFKASALSTANAVLEYLEEAVKLNYIKDDAVDILKSYIGDSSKSDDLEAELNQLAIETNYINTKIEKICQFKPMNVAFEQLSNIEKCLLEMQIDERHISKFYTTDFVLQLTKGIKERIEELSANTGKLKGLFIRHQNKMNKLSHMGNTSITKCKGGFTYDA
mgnify:CR=1 FL=1